MADDDILFKALLDTADFDGGMEVLTGALRRVGEIAVDAFLQAGQAVVGFAADSFQSALDAEQAMTRIEQVIQSTGGAAGLTAEDVADLGVEFQNLAGGTDDTVIAIEEMALRMGNISKDEMPDFIQTTLDLAAATGVDAVQAARLLAQAQEDPLSVMARLQKQGILFSEDLRTQAKAMMDAGDTAGAFALVMGRVTEATSGAAAAQAGTLAGQWEIFKNTISEAGEAAASALLPVLHQLTDNILPVLVPLLTELGTAFGAAFGALLEGDIGGAIEVFGEFDSIRAIIQGLGIDLYSVSGTVENFVENAQAQFAAFLVAVQPIVDAAQNLVTVFMASMPQIEQTVANMVAFVGGLIEQFSPAIVANVTTALDAITLFWQNHGAQIMAIVQIAWEFISTTVGVALTLLSAAIALAMEAINGDWAGAWETVKTTFISVMDSILSIVGMDLDSFIETWQGTFDLALQIIQTVWGNIVQAVKDAVAGILGAILNVIAGIQGFIDKILSIPPLPEWLTPGSPTPLESGLWGIADALKAVTNSLPSLSIPAGGVSNVTNSSINNWNLGVTTNQSPAIVTQSFAVARALAG